MFTTPKQEVGGVVGGHALDLMILALTALNFTILLYILGTGSALGTDVD